MLNIEVKAGVWTITIMRDIRSDCRIFCTLLGYIFKIEIKEFPDECS